MDVSNDKKDINLDFLIQFCSVFLFCMILEVPILQSNKLDHSVSTKCTKIYMISRSVQFIYNSIKCLELYILRIISLYKSSNYLTPNDFQVSSV